MTYALTAVSAGKAAFDGYAANESAKAKAGQLRVEGMASQAEGALTEQLKIMEAGDIRSQAAAQANKIKSDAIDMHAQMVNAQTGSGVVIGEGSALAAVDRVNALATSDAIAALYSGVNASVSATAQGRFAMKAGYEKNKASNAAATSAENAGELSLIGGFLQAGGLVAAGIAKATNKKGGA